MKILMVTERYLPIWGGAENQLRQLIPHLVERGCDVKIVTRRWHHELSRTEFIDQTEVIRLGIPGLGIIATGCFILSLIWYVVSHRKQIDILHSHGAVNMGALCAILGRILQLKNVAKIATADRVPRLANNFFGKVVLSIFQKSSAIISMTNEIDAELSEIDTPIEIIYRITNGVDCERFKPASELKRTEWRLNQGMKEDTPIIIFSSRLVQRKGLDILLDAWPEISDSYPEVYLVVVGSGKDQPDSVEEEMTQMAATRQLRHVLFVGDTEKPECFLEVADIFVFPSRIEGFPNALMEALASGLAVVASRIGGVEAVLSNSNAGLTFSTESSNDLAVKVLYLLGHRDVIREKGNEACRLMLDRYSFQFVSSEYAKLYSQL